MNFQDWETVSWDKRGQKPKDQSTKTFIANEARKGNIVQTLKPVTANQNKVNIVTNVKKIEKEEETFKHTLVGMEIGKKIAHARCEKKLTQKQLANALSLQESIIKEHENGKAIYNAVIMNKLEKYLGQRFRK